MDPAPVRQGLMVVDGAGSVQLVAGRCASCRTLVFPRPAACPVCAGAGIGDELVGATGGSLWLWTVVRTAPPGYEGPVPYGFGVVTLDEGIRVLGRLLLDDAVLDDAVALSVGRRVRCVDDGVAWAFALDAEPEPGS